MTRTLLAALLLAPLAALAQDAGGMGPRYRVTPALPDTLTTAAFDALADPAAFTGVVADRYPDGRFKLLRSVVGGRTTGLWTEWYPSGVVRYLGQWAPGEGGGPSVGEGAWFYFHENGAVRYREVYRADRADGPSEGWHANGRKAFQGAHRDGDRVGRWRWWGEGGALDSTRAYGGWRPETGDAKPRRFAPGVVSTDDAEPFGLALTPDGLEAYVTRRAPGERQSIVVSRFESGAWAAPEPAPFSTGTDESPSVTADGQRLYFASRRPGALPDDPHDESDNLWAVERAGDAWGAPRPVPGVSRPRPAGESWPVGSELHPSVGPDGALYYWTQEPGGTPDLYRAAPDGDGFAPGRPLPAPVNTAAAEASPAFGPGGVLVFQAYARPGGAGGEDLFASWPDGDGWTVPVPLPVNTDADEYLPTFSTDGRTLFFTRGDGEGAASVYYVDWSELRLSRP